MELCGVRLLMLCSFWHMFSCWHLLSAVPWAFGWSMLGASVGAAPVHLWSGQRFTNPALCCAVHMLTAVVVCVAFFVNYLVLIRQVLFGGCLFGGTYSCTRCISAFYLCGICPFVLVKPPLFRIPTSKPWCQARVSVLSVADSSWREWVCLFASCIASPDTLPMWPPPFLPSRICHLWWCSCERI